MAPSNIVVVSLENENFSALVGNTAEAPFLNQLISQGMLFTNFDALAHPSQPNYLALFSGSTQGVVDDTVPSEFPSSVPTLASSLAASGYSFGGYAEAGASPWHQPWAAFANSAADAKDLSQFPTTAAGFAGLPTVSFVTPSDANNMTPTDDGGGGIAAGDQWLATNLAAYAAWAQANNSLLVITFDENNDAPVAAYPNQVMTLVVGAGVPAGVTNDSPANQYSLLSTIESLYGLTPVGESAGAPPLDFYDSTPASAATTYVTDPAAGISDPNNTPPENGLAVGTNYVVTAETSNYEVTDLKGHHVAGGSLYGLFASLPAGDASSLNDPRVAYDSSTGTYVLSEVNIGTGGTAVVDLAVSKDPSQGWTVGYVQAVTGPADSADMPYLSVGNGQIFLSTGDYLGSGGSGTSEQVLNESAVAGGAVTPVASEFTSANDYNMRNVAGDNGATYYLSAHSDGNRTVLTYQTYDAKSQTFGAKQTFGLGDSDQGHPSSGYFSAAQLGSSKELNIGDSRIQSLAYASQNGHDYVYGVSEIMASGATQPSVEWFQLDVTSPNNPVYVNGNVIAGSSIGPNVAVFNPSIAVDAKGDVLINFTASGPDMYASDYYVVRGANTADFGAPTLYQASNAAFDSGSQADQRWGTYSSAVADPNDPNGFWISNEYVTTSATSPSNSAAWWDTVTAQVEVSCFAAGTLIATPAGDKAVESLRPGDLVLTAGGPARPIAWLGKQTIATAFADPLRVAPIRVKAGALAHGVPHRDLRLSPDHALFVDGLLIQAGALVNGTSIVRETGLPASFCYYHVELDDHALILAEGAAAETFVDNVDRLGFDNWGEHEAAYPDGKPIAELPYPRAKASRQVPATVRFALDERAKAIGAGVRAA